MLRLDFTLAIQSFDCQLPMRITHRGWLRIAKEARRFREHTLTSLSETRIFRRLSETPPEGSWRIQARLARNSVTPRRRNMHKIASLGETRLRVTRSSTLSYLLQTTPGTDQCD